MEVAGEDSLTDGDDEGDYEKGNPNIVKDHCGIGIGGVDMWRERSKLIIKI